MKTHTRTAARLVLPAAAALALAAGCAGGSGGQAGGREADVNAAKDSGRGHSQERKAQPRETPRDSASAGPVGTTVRVAVADGQVSPPPRRITAAKGERVRLVVRSDHADRVHVHGYDLEQRVTPTQPAVITFTADQVGVFEVETHDPALQLLQLRVR